MQKRKLFIEIDVPEGVKKRLFEKTEKWRDAPVKWTRKENLHITLLFLGYVDESVIPEICQKTAQAASKMDSFDLVFDKIALGPSPEKPQMVWFSGQASEELRELYENVQKGLDVFQEEKKTFRPHITLGKIRKRKWEQMDQKPEIDVNFKVSIPVESISVMESGAGEDAQEYHAIERCFLA